MEYHPQEKQRKIRSISLDQNFQKKMKSLTKKSAEGFVDGILMLRGQGFWNLDMNV